MAVPREFENYVIEQLELAGEIDSRRMFGGVGIYIDEVFCALIDGEGKVYLRVGPSNVQDFIEAGMPQFRPFDAKSRNNKGMPYYEIPVDILEDRDRLRDWSLKAREAAVAARKQ